MTKIVKVSYDLYVVNGHKVRLGSVLSGYFASWTCDLGIFPSLADAVKACGGTK